MKQKIIISDRSPQITAIIAILLHALPGRRSVEVDIPYCRHNKGSLDRFGFCWIHHSSLKSSSSPILFIIVAYYYFIFIIVVVAAFSLFFISSSSSNARTHHHTSSSRFDP